MKAQEVLAALQGQHPDAEVFVRVDDEGVLHRLDLCYSAEAAVVAYNGEPPDPGDGTGDQFYSDTSAPKWEGLPSRHGYPREPRVLVDAVVLSTNYDWP